MRILPVLTAAFAIFAAPAMAASYDSAVAGKIISVDVTDATNYAFRIALEGRPAMCGAGSDGWAYVNKSYDNYDAMVSTLTSIWLAGKSVTIYTKKLAGTTHCQIVYITAR